MAATARQPFALLDGARLQALTSTKNRQNAAAAQSQSPASKRKAPSWTEADDAENVDPVFFSKRCKGSNGATPACGAVKKPAFTLTRASTGVTSTFFSTPRPVQVAPVASKPRTILKPRAPSTKITTTAKVDSGLARLSSSRASMYGSGSGSGSSTIRAPKRGGILSSKRRAASSFAASSSSFNCGPAAPFSLDAALKGTFSSFEARMASSALATPLGAALDDSLASSSWFFDIHEDTPEQEMTNLLQHSTCVLDISSDEEYEQKARRERAEGRDKENIPPANDISQTSAARLDADTTDDMSVEKARNPLSALNAADYYATGCDEASVFLVPSDETDETDETDEQPEAVPPPIASVLDKAQAQDEETAAQTTQTCDPEEVDKARTDESESPVELSVDDIMGRRDSSADEAALLKPIEGTGESFQLWESGSAKDEDLGSA